MKIHYIQPKTEVIVAVTQTVLAGSGGGGLSDFNAKKNTYIDDDREEASDDIYSPWPQPKSLWND